MAESRPQNGRFPTLAILVAILLLAVAIRVPLIASPGQYWDMLLFSHWGRVTANQGLASLYAVHYLGIADCDYPPLYMAAMSIIAVVQSFRHVGFNLTSDPVYLLLLKALPLVGDLALILAVYLWPACERRWKWIIALALALSPGVILCSAWWGQVDGMLTLVIVACVMAILSRRPRLAWLFFALGLLLKTQAVVIFPLLVVLTYRRYGLRVLITGVLLAAASMAMVLLPIILVSGVDNGLRPYLQTVGVFPQLSVSAPTIWTLLSNRPFNTPDNIPILLGLNARVIGLGLFAFYTLYVLVLAWKHTQTGQDFVWVSALYLGFFMLNTEMHERYLYPAAVLLLFAVLQRPVLWAVALGTSVSLAGGMALVSSPGAWQSYLLLLSVPVLAVLNCLVFASVLLNLERVRRQAYSV